MSLYDTSNLLDFGCLTLRTIEDHRWGHEVEFKSILTLLLHPRMTKYSSIKITKESNFGVGND